jgi:hypothetical protein
MPVPFSVYKIKAAEFSKMFVSAYNIQSYNPEDYGLNVNKSQKTDFCIREFKFWLGNQQPNMVCVIFLNPCKAML